MRNIRCIISYEGTRYLGWQKTRMGPSIEEELEKAFSILLRHPVELQAASRTDAGVHAKGQVVNFFTSHESLNAYRWLVGVNALLPLDIRVLHLEEAPQQFHPTLDTIGKIYSYEICTGPVQSPFLHLHSWHFPHSLDMAAMCHASNALLGTHDFSSFCNERSSLEINPLCTIKEIVLSPPCTKRLRILVHGNRFLYKMMRNLVGSIAYVGCGKLAPDAISKILFARDRRLAGMTAPAHGLYLKHVLYSTQ